MGNARPLSPLRPLRMPQSALSQAASVERPPVKSAFSRDRIHDQRWPPTSFLIQHRVQDHDQLVHARDYGNVSRFPSSTKTLIEGPDNWIAAQCGHRTHVKHRAHLGAATPDPALAAHGTAIA